MNVLQSIWQWVTTHSGISIVVGLVGLYFAVVLLTILYQRFGFYSWYLLIVLAATVGALTTELSSYFIVFLLGMTTAFAEIISKFRDEPLKALEMPHALFYHLTNGVIAVFALKFLLLFGIPFSTPQDRFKAVLAAGLGSMLVMRSKLFNIKTAGEDISFGPEQIVKTFFRFMEAAIDRIRAQARIEFVRSKLGHVNPDKVFDYSVTMLMASQALEDKDRKDCLAAIKELRRGEFKELPPQLKSYRLGFILLDNMGEDFVSKLFKDIPPTWFLEAPVPEKQEDSLVDKVSRLPLVPSIEKEALTPYFAYGSSMSSEQFRQRLGPAWKEMNDTYFRQVTKPQKATLEGYRLMFSEGRANLIRSETADRVEGVVYHLSDEAIKYLDLTETGYHRARVKIKVDGKEVESDTYFTQLGHASRPKIEYLRSILEGAREFELSPDYQKKIEAEAAQEADAAVVQPTTPSEDEHEPELPKNNGDAP